MQLFKTIMKPVLLIVLLFNLLFMEGCSYNKKDKGNSYCTFESHPQGATVLIGDQKGITPCKLKIDKKSQKVVIIHPDGMKREVTLPDYELFKIDLYKVANRTTSVTLKTLSVPFFLLCVPVWGIAFWQTSFTNGRYSDEMMNSGCYLCGIVAAPGVYLWQKSDELDDAVERRRGYDIRKNYVFIDFIGEQ